MNIALFMDELMSINGPLMLVPRNHKHGVPRQSGLRVGAKHHAYPRRIVYLTLCAVSDYIHKPTRPEWIALYAAGYIGIHPTQGEP